MENRLCHEHAVIEVLAAAAGFGEAEKAIGARPSAARTPGARWSGLSIKEIRPAISGSAATAT
jgi:hypothetical protein